MTNNTWASSTLEDLSDNLDNKRVPVSKMERKKGNIPYYGATGIVDYVDDYIFNEELLLIGEDGADWSPGANTAFIINGKSWVNNHAHVLRITKANADFVMNYLNYADLRQHTTGTTRGKLNKASLMSIQIPTPPLKIQNKVADILSSLDEAIQKTDQIIQKTEDLKHGLMVYLLDSSKHPKKKMVDLLELSQYGLSVKSSSNGEYPMLRMNNYLDGRIVPYPLVYVNLNEKDFNTYKLKTGDILFNRTNSHELVGKTGIFNLQGDYVFASYLVRLRVNHKLLLPEYLTYYMNSIEGKKQIESMKSRGVSQSNINPTIMKNKFTCPTPSISEQRRIVEILNAVDTKLNKEKENKNSLYKLKSGFMEDIFNQKVQIN